MVESKQRWSQDVVTHVVIVLSTEVMSFSFLAEQYQHSKKPPNEHIEGKP